MRLKLTTRPDGVITRDTQPTGGGSAPRRASFLRRTLGAEVDHPGHRRIAAGTVMLITALAVAPVSFMGGWRSQKVQVDKQVDQLKGWLDHAQVAKMRAEDDHTLLAMLFNRARKIQANQGGDFNKCIWKAAAELGIDPDDVKQLIHPPQY